MKGGGLALYNLIQPTISLEMPVPSQGHYGFHSFLSRFFFFFCPLHCLFFDLRLLITYLVSSNFSYPGIQNYDFGFLLLNNFSLFIVFISL
jgi:hypothetical protein